ncbi:MAG: hypothetical protein ACO1Q7_13835 [Gemmatimonas sp.]
MKGRLFLQATVATLAGSLLTAGIMRVLSLSHMDLSPEKLIVLLVGLPVVMALLAVRIASAVRPSDSGSAPSPRWVMWGLAVGINYWCVSGLFVGPLLGEVTSVGGMWLLWAILAGALSGAARSANYGKRHPVSLPESKAQTFMFRAIVIVSALASASVIIPIAMMVISMFAG